MIRAVRGYAALCYGDSVGDADRAYAETAVVYAMISGAPLPTPDKLGIDYASYLNGLAEARGEFWRHILAPRTKDQTEEADAFLAAMGEICHSITGFDYPNTISDGRRGRSDVLRETVHRSRGDLINSLRQARLKGHLAESEERLSQ